jgi:predicted nucleotide-binding protein
MTAEDEQADGNHHARMNVIHEVGLFQGRLGFERAIVLLYHLSNRTIIIWCFYF